MPIALTAVLFAVCIVALAAILKFSSQEKYSSLKKIHREQKLGSVISAIALSWGGIQGYELLGQDFPSIAGIIPILTPLLIIGVYFLMDYIFTRALGGIIIMLICELFYRSQDVEMPARFIFSLLGYTFAVAAMYMVGQPWRFRDYLFKAAENKQLGAKFSSIILASLVVMFIPFLIAYV